MDGACRGFVSAIWLLNTASYGGGTRWSVRKNGKQSGFWHRQSIPSLDTVAKRRPAIRSQGGPLG